MSTNSGANLGFEDKLWMAADKLRGTMDSQRFDVGVNKQDLIYSTNPRIIKRLHNISTKFDED